MKLLLILLIVGILILFGVILFFIKYSTKKILNVLIGSVLVTLAYFALFFFLKKMNLIDAKFYLYLSVPTFFLLLIIRSLYNDKKVESKKNNSDRKFIIRLEHTRGVIEYYNPFNGFLIYGGAESGKTAFIGKNLLAEFMKNGFALFIYDAKRYDYTLTALKLKEELDYPYPIYNLDFTDPSRSYRTNIFTNKVIKNDALVSEFAEVFFISQMKDDYKKDQWFSMALGMFKGVAFVFFKAYQEYCSLPHICNFILQNPPEVIEAFLRGENSTKERSIFNTAIGLSSAFLNSESKTRTSILTTIGDMIGDFGSNKIAGYVLTGNDFIYQPLDPQNPKSIAISNTFELRNTISPLVVLLFVIYAKQIEFGNKIPFVNFLDEATTFKIPDLESYPSELREYLISFVVLTQSPSKIEKLYRKEDRASLESNLANQFYGWTADSIALDNYAKQFSKKDEVQRSRTVGERNRSVTHSTREKVRYDGEFFASLKAGEFVGKTKNSNIKTFHYQFKPFTGGKLEEMPIVRNVSDQDLEQNYLKIIDDVTVRIFE